MCMYVVLALMAQEVKSHASVCMSISWTFLVWFQETQVSKTFEQLLIGREIAPRSICMCLDMQYVVCPT